MKMKKETPYVDGFTNNFVIFGKHYVMGDTIWKKIGKVKHIDKILLEEVEPKKEASILDEIARRMNGKVSPEKIIREAIKKQLGTFQRKELLKLLKDGKAKIKEHDGCYGIELKGRYFQLFD